MRFLSGWFRGPWLMALLVACLALSESMAEAGRGGHGGRGGRAPRMAAPRRASAAPRMQASRMVHNANTARTNHQTANNTNGKNNAANLNGNSRTAAAGIATGTSMSRPNMYSYGSGANARRYTANGYGQGYRNRYGNRGYGRSQGNARAIVSRLRSVHSTLARIDHDYRGHRAKAAHSISNAIRVLSHRSRGYNQMGMGGANGIGGANRMLAANNRNAGVGRNNNNNRGAGNGVRGNRMSQAQSDSLMSHALRTTQGIHMQLANQGTRSNHNVARTHVSRAIREMNMALAVR